MAKSIKTKLVIVLTTLFTAGLYIVHSQMSENNSCVMTWMWRRIILTPVEVKGAEDSPYTLKHYTEGRYPGINYRGKKNDIVALFVPGSGGSGFQVRSLASVMLNKTEMRRTPFTMQFYAVDFNEELSFLSGRILQKQRDFVVKSIEALKARHSRSSFNKIILFGHSFGGVVINALPLHPDFDGDSMDLVITLAAPLHAPPLLMDRQMLNFYKEVRSYWATKKKPIGLLSYSGGEKDFQVPDRLANTSYIHHLPSWSVRRVDTSVDHLCILWCNELVRHSSRLMLSYILDKWRTPTTKAAPIVSHFYQEELARATIKASVKQKNIHVSLFLDQDVDTIGDRAVSYQFDFDPYRAVRFSLEWDSKCASIGMEAHYPNGLVAKATSYGSTKSSVLFLPQQVTGRALVVISGPRGCRYSLSWYLDVPATWYLILTGFIGRAVYVFLLSTVLGHISDMFTGVPSDLWSFVETFSMCCVICDGWLTLSIPLSLTVSLLKINVQYAWDAVSYLFARFYTTVGERSSKSSQPTKRSPFKDI